MKITLLVFILLISCSQDIEKQKKDTKNDSLKTNIKETSSYSTSLSSYYQDSLFYKLFAIKFYDSYGKLGQEKDYTLIVNKVDTSIAFYFPLYKNRNSREVENLLKDNKKLMLQFNNISSGLFFLREIKLIENNIYLGIFVEYFGYGRICYLYGILKLNEGVFHIEDLYYRLDRTGIGSFKYSKIINLGNHEFFLVGENKGEGHQSLAIHHFPSNYKNRTYIFEKCKPSGEGNPHDEKLEYFIDYNNLTIHVEKYEIEHDKEKEWRLLYNKKYDLLDLVNLTKKETTVDPK